MVRTVSKPFFSLIKSKFQNNSETYPYVFKTPKVETTKERKVTLANVLIRKKIEVSEHETYHFHKVQTLQKERKKETLINVSLKSKVL
jgi:hypothetical protein